MVAVNPTRPRLRATATRAELVDVPTEAAPELPTEVPAEAPTETLEPSPTEAPTDTPEPAESSTPRPTRTPAPPTKIPPPTETFTPAPPPAPTRCPNQFCIVKADCLPGENTRAIGHVFGNGVPLNDVLVRVSTDYAGAKVADDFFSGHDPVNRNVLDSTNPGYYQVGISDGSVKPGTYVVFLIDRGTKQPISEGRSFTVDATQTGNSCQIGVTDFGS